MKTKKHNRPKTKDLRLKTQNSKGFVLLLLFTVIILLGVVMVLLSTASNTMMFQANKVYLQACERNLIFSGMNWAQLNIQKDNSQIINNTIELDVNDMNILRSSLNINTIGPGDPNEKYQVQITATCGRARLNLESDEIYTIEP